MVLSSKKMSLAIAVFFRNRVDKTMFAKCTKREIFHKQMGIYSKIEDLSRQNITKDIIPKNHKKEI